MYQGTWGWCWTNWRGLRLIWCGDKRGGKNGILVNYCEQLSVGKKSIQPPKKAKILAHLSKRMTYMTGIHVKGLIKPNKKLDDSRGRVFIVIKPTTFPLNVPKWSRLEIGGFSAESNYVLIAPVTDIELIAAGVTDAKTANVNTTRQFVTTQPNQWVEDFWRHKTKAYRAKSFILLLWSRWTGSNVVHSSTRGQAAHTGRRLF